MTETNATGDITGLLVQLRAGDGAAMRRLFPLAYDALRQLAHRALLGSDGDRTLSTTALVNEAYLQLAARDRAVWNDRQHFYAYAAQAMRHILVDHARRRGAAKRGGAVRVVDWSAVAIPVDALSVELLALDQALDRLAALDEALVRIVELRYFAGLSVEDTAEALGMAPRSFAE